MTSSFVAWIEGIDARHGIPRPAEMQSMAAYHAFLRVMSAAVMMLLLTGFGFICAYLLWLSAGYGSRPGCIGRCVRRRLVRH